jgi:60S ribosomal subunit assembly/export protein LOC1
LNTITPAGVQKPRGKKKGKVFVDDAESMRTILALVSAEREGQIESKMQKARQMEEIRESRRKEMENKEDERKRKLDEVKDGVWRKRKSKRQADDDGAGVYDAGVADRRKSRKRVSFG